MGIKSASSGGPARIYKSGQRGVDQIKLMHMKKSRIHRLLGKKKKPPPEVWITGEERSELAERAKQIAQEKRDRKAQKRLGL